MKYLITLLLILNLISCNTNKKEVVSKKLNDSGTQNKAKITNESAEKIRIDKKIATDNRLDLDEILSSNENEYLVSFSNGVLNMCCYYEIIDLEQFLIRSNFEKSIETYESDAKTDTVLVFKNEKSFFKEYYNNHPKVKHLDLVYGEIFDDKHIDNKKIKIGLNKVKFLEQFFKPSEILGNINQFSISDDELGEAETIFKFEDDKLKVIIFNSVYEWINKNI